MSKQIKHRGLTVGVLFAAIAQVLWPAASQAQSVSTGDLISTAGTAPTLTQGATKLTVTLNGSRTIANWTRFNVGSGYTFEVIGASASDILLNRVLGGTISSIDGLVQSNANVWLINTNGIAVGSAGRFDVGGLLLSTSDLADADFLDGNLNFSFSGTSTNQIIVYPSAQLQANTGGIVLLADSINTYGSMTSAGDNTLFGVRAMTVTFDATLGAVTTYTVDLPSTQTYGVTASGGASFSGNRHLLMSEGMVSGQGNVLLNNPGGATDVVFQDGNVELVSNNSNVTAQGVFTTPGDLTMTAGSMIVGNGGATVGGNYSITGQDFTGGVFSPNLVGANSSLSITDTQGSLPIGNISAPGDINITVTGGSITTTGPFTSADGDVSLTAAGDIFLGGNLTGAVVALNAGSSISQTAGMITANALYASAGFGIALDNINAWSAAAFANSGTGDISANSILEWTLLSATSHGKLTVDGPTIHLAGTVQATDDVEVSAAAVLDGDTDITSTNGYVYLQDVDGGASTSNFTVTAGAESLFGNVGATTALTSLTVNGQSTFSGSILTTTGAIDLDDAVFTGIGGLFNVSAGGAFSANSVTTQFADIFLDARGIQIGSVVAGDPSGTGNIFDIDSGVGDIVLGSVFASEFHATGSGDLTVSGVLQADELSGFVGGSATFGGDNQVASIGAFTSDGFSLRNVRDLAIDGVVNGNTGDAQIEVAGGDLQVNATGTLRGNNVAVSASSFVNLSGADALDAAGHWVVYQQAPLLTDYDGLDSGNTAIWGETLASLDPTSVTGNRYVFAFAPTLTFTTVDTSKVYGTDLTGSLASLYNITGYQPGVAGAYLADDAASVFSGAPSVTSGGLAERASVAGGPYAIGIANGSLTALNGYQFTFDGAGNLTVTPKALTGTATTDAKTYDGNADGSGSISLSGVVAGDTVGASGIFTFVDKNAGLGKTVNLTGATLSGADAGNYTISVPATTVGDILQKAITGTGSVDTKTYDGTNAGSGTITLSGVVAGDDVGADGTFTFVDENAGTGKAVTLSGVTLTGTGAGNYTLAVPGSVLGDILRKAITGTVTVNAKTYDGTANGSGNVTLAGVIAGDSVAGSATFMFGNKNAGTGKTVTVSGAALSGADADNYTVTLPASALGDILQKAITGTATATTKTYDGSASGSGTVALSGVVADDDVNASATFAFDDENAGTGKTVTVSGGTLAGVDAGNYTLTLPASVLGDILQKAITGTATASTKTYDGTNAGSGTVALSGVVAGDNVTGSATFTFSDENAGTSKTVTVSGATLSGVDAGNYTVTLPASVLGDILQKAITGTTTATTKTYDGTTAGSGTVGLSGVVAGDDVAGSATFTFSDENAGTSKTVTISGATLSGADAGNYTVTLPASTFGDILQKAITGTATASTKTYDGTNAGSGTVALSGVVAGDNVNGSATFTFSDENAGTSKTVTVSGATLSGADAGNYTVTLPASVLGDILQKAITGTATASTKTYDGTAAGSGTVGLSGVIAGDDLAGSATFTFSDKNAGTSKTVTVSGATLSGADAGNYTVTLPASVLGDILQKAITGTATASTKTYDGANAGSGTVALSGVVAGDNVNGSATFTFSDKNAGTSKTVTVSGATLSGTDAANYTITLPASVLGDILQKAITGTATASTKTYDGTTAGSGTVSLSGVVAGDDVNGSATFTFTDKNAGTAKTVTVSGATLSGTDAANYTVTLPASVLGDILQKAITGTATVSTRTYDGTTDGSGSIALSGVVAGDAVGAGGTFKFTDKNAGSGKVVTVSGVTLSGADAGNYTISVPASAIGEILRKSITGTATVADKTYDGTRTGTGSIALDGVVAGDSIGANGTYTFSDANAGTDKAVAVEGVSLSGADAGNYTVVVSGSTVADILRRAITVTADPMSRLQGDADPALTYDITQGSLASGDALSGSLARAAGEDPGQYTIGQGTLDASSNYQLTFVGSTLTITAVDSGPTDPTEGVVVKDNVGGVVSFLLGLTASSDARDGTLQIVDERPVCEPGAASATCQAARRD